MLRDQEDEKSNKHRKMNIRRDDLGIEIVGLDRMDEKYHRNTSQYNPHLTAVFIPESIADDHNRYPREKCPKYWDKSEDKHDQCQSQEIRKGSMPISQHDHDQSEARQDRIHESDDRLSPKDNPEAIIDLRRDDRPLMIEKGKISFFNLQEKISHLFSLDDKDIGKEECEEKLDQDESSILQRAQDSIPE